MPFCSTKINETLSYRKHAITTIHFETLGQLESQCHSQLAMRTVKCLWGVTPYGVQMGTNILKESPAFKPYPEEGHRTFI